jgi:chitinase
MKAPVVGQLLVTAVLIAGAQGASTQQRPPEGALIVGYYVAYAVRTGFPVDSIDGDRLTHINYAFANIDAEGRAVLGNPCLDVGDCVGEADPNARPGGNFAELRRLKERHPHLRTLISIGGWDWSAWFSDVAATPEARRRFVESTLDLFIRGHPGVFDGIDLDWEYPVEGGLPGNRRRPEDRRNHTLLASDFRRALDELGRRENKRYVLTIAAPAAPQLSRNFELDALGRILDFIMVMAYDYHTGDVIAHFNAPLGVAEGDPTPEKTVRATVDSYLAAGVPKEKLVVGVPFFGYGYGGVDAVRNGLFQRVERDGPEASPAPGSWIGIIRYRQIAEAMRSGFTRHWDSEAGVPWVYNARTRNWITYDDPQSLALKADLVRERGLGGIMVWELSGDDGTLLPAIHHRLRSGR